MSHLFDDETVDRAREADFDDVPDFSAPPLVILDRSTLERYAECSMQARLIESNAVVNATVAMNAGQEVHEAFAEAVAEYIAIDDSNLRPGDVADIMRGRLLAAHPSIQPEVIDAAWHSAYQWAKYVCGLNPGNILRFDNGIGDRSGQLAVDIPSLGCTVTSEVDLLHSGPSRSTLHGIDYKSGRTAYSVGAVARSFQFQMHAYLVFENYPDVDAYEVTVIPTRFGGWIQPVEFRREDMPKFAARVGSAAKIAMAMRGLPLEQVDVVPGAERCSACPVAARCRITPAESCAADPQAFVLSMHTLSCVLDAMKGEAAAYVATNGEIKCNGLAFGINKPKSTKKPSSDLYLTNGEPKNAED